jgi:hypothetical protein
MKQENNKQATMRAALRSFQSKLATSNRNNHEYPNLVGKPTDPTSYHPAATTTTTTTTNDGGKKEEEEEDYSEAQNELFRRGFEQGYEDARVFSGGVKDLEGVVSSEKEGETAVTKMEGKMMKKIVGGYSIGHLNRWKKIRARQFVDANPTSSSLNTSATFSHSHTLIGPSESLWDKVLSLLHLRSSTTTTTTTKSGANESVEGTLASVWEYMDGFVEGVKAFEAVGSGGSANDAVKKWGEQFVNANKDSGSKAGLKSFF